MKAGNMRASFFASSLVMMTGLLPFIGSELRAQPNGLGSWKKEFELKGHTGNVESLAFSPDGKLMAAGDSSGTVRLWDVATGKERTALRTQRGNVLSLAFSPSGNLLATGNLGAGDSSVRLWEVPSGKELAGLKGPEFSVISVAFSPDGKLLAAAGSSGYTGAVAAAYTVMAWDISTRKEIFRVDQEFSGSGLVPFLADSRTLAIPRPNGTLKLWNVTTKKARSEFQMVGDSAFGLALQGKALVVPSQFLLSGMAVGEGLGPDKKTLASADPKAILLYNLESGKLQASLKSGEKTGFYSLTAEGKILLAAGYEDPEGPLKPILRWWDLSTGKELGCFRGLTGGWITSLSLSPDAKRMAISRGTELSLWISDKAGAEK
jgi:WD40 repeat protein